MAEIACKQRLDSYEFSLYQIMEEEIPGFKYYNNEWKCMRNCNRISLEVSLFIEKHGVTFSKQQRKHQS